MYADEWTRIPRLLEEVVMVKYLLLVLSVWVCASTMAEMHVWTFNNGKTLEAEFIAYSGNQISLKNIKGKVKKIEIAQFGEEDLRYIELLNPPKLDVEVTKTTERRKYPPTEPDSPNLELPRSAFYTFTGQIKQRSNKVYTQELMAEIFVIGGENNGDKYILYNYTREKFYLTDGSQSLVKIVTEPITITEYVLNGQLRGEAYEGCMLIVSDSRGEIIASNAKKEDWINIVENLRKLPVGKTFDENGERCWPTRPRRFY